MRREDPLLKGALPSTGIGRYVLPVIAGAAG